MKIVNIFDRLEWKRVVNYNLVHPEIIVQCNTLYKSKTRFAPHHIKALAYFALHNLHDIYDRFEKLIEFISVNGNKNTLERHVLCFGEIDGPKIFDEYKDKKLHSKQKYIQRYGIDGEQRWNEFLQKCSGNKTFDRFIEKYGSVKGPIKWKQFRAQEQSKGTKKYWMDRYGEARGTEMYNSKLAKIHKSSTKDEIIKRVGAENYKTYKDNTSIKSFIVRHGPIIGPHKYNKFTAIKQYNNTLDCYIQKYGEVVGASKYYTWLKTSALGVGGYSRVSQELFKIINTQSDDKVYYGSLNKEYVLSNFSTQRVTYFYDYVNVTKRKVIEFNGDIWHANPSIYAATDTPNPYIRDKTAAQIWYDDELKLNAIKQHRGYDVLVVWEKDYRENKQSVVDACINFLNL